MLSSLVLFIIGDWNAKVGSQETPGVTGKFGLGICNEAGQILIEFCQENALVITNTLFQQHKRRLYTWTSPDGQHQNQTDYILCSQRWRSSIQSAKTRPGADCGSDHEIFIAIFRLKLKKVGNTTKPFSTVQLSRSVVSDSLRPHELQQARPPVHHQFPEFTQIYVHWVSDAIQPSHPLSSPSPPAPNPSQHQSLFQWVNSSHEVAQVLEFQLQHQSFQWTPRTDHPYISKIKTVQQK